MCIRDRPLIDENSTLSIPGTVVTPRDAAAEDGMRDWWSIASPAAAFEEQVFHHAVSSASRAAHILSPGSAVTLTLTWSDTLGSLFQWRMLRERDYVLGLEPVSYTHLDVYKRQAAGCVRRVLHVRVVEQQS